MYWASVTVELEAANARPRFAPILVRGIGPRKGATPSSARGYHLGLRQAEVLLKLISSPG